MIRSMSLLAALGGLVLVAEAQQVCPPASVGVCAELCPIGSACPAGQACCSNGCGHQCTNTVEVGSVCPSEDFCGAPLKAPSCLCADGSLGCNTGRCLVTGEGTCGWEIRECPAECVDPWGNPADPVQCLVDPCDNARCPANPDATCRANYCGGCHAVFYDEAGAQVDCNSNCVDPWGNSGMLVSCVVDPCTVNECVAHPDATCTPNYCGGCHAVYTDDAGVMVDCNSNCVDPWGNPGMLVSCIVDPCTVNKCAANPDATCTANYCGGCHAVYTDDAGVMVDCDEPSCTGRWGQRWDSTAKKIRSVPAPSGGRGNNQDECCALCAETDGCVAFTYWWRGGWCVLYSSVGGTVNQRGTYAGTLQ